MGERDVNDLVQTSKMDKTVLSVTSLTDQSEDRTYWLSKTPQERLEAVEFLRTLNYGYDATSARLQRVLATAPLRGD